VRGSVVSIPQGSFGASATPQSAIANATVVIGSTLVVGATPPPSVPAGDVIVTTDGNGNFNANVPQAPSAPTTYPFMSLQTNVFNVTTPSTGYYVSVFAPDADGKSAGAPLPFHGFLAVNSGAVGTIRITTASAIEAAFLTDVNTFRTSKGAGALIFDELAEEAARLHATDEATSPEYYCHFDRSNIGPSSRYLKLGGLGLDGENIDESWSSATAYQDADTAFESEGPGGGHYDNLVDTRHRWTGLAQVSGSRAITYVDQELISPSESGYATYQVFTGSNCPTGTTANGS
jgi:uncharacterized protein YkwD